MRLLLGVKRRPFRFLTLAGGSFLVLWSGFEPIVSLVGIKAGNGPFWLVCLILVAVLVGLFRCIPPTTVDIRFSNTQCRVEIKFGSIFVQEGIRVIPVNRFFDSELGELVSPNSLHGKLLTNKFRGNRQEFDAAVAPHLAAKPSTEVPSKKGKIRDYGIGTTILFGTSTERYLLISTADTDLATLKASTDFDTVWSALAMLWEFARVNCGGDPIVVPLIGGGLSGLKLSHRRILDMMLLSLVYHSRIRDIGCKVVLIIESDRISEIDLRDVANNWSS
jgi:Domain of unknown function (DUF6430)